MDGEATFSGGAAVAVCFQLYGGHFLLGFGCVKWWFQSSTSQFHASRATQQVPLDVAFNHRRCRRHKGAQGVIAGKTVTGGKESSYLAEIARDWMGKSSSSSAAALRVMGFSGTQPGHAFRGGGVRPRSYEYATEAGDSLLLDGEGPQGPLMTFPTRAWKPARQEPQSQISFEPSATGLPGIIPGGAVLPRSTS